MVRAVLDGESLTGTWFDRTKEYASNSALPAGLVPSRASFCQSVPGSGSVDSSESSRDDSNIFCLPH